MHRHLYIFTIISHCRFVFMILKISQVDIFYFFFLIFSRPYSANFVDWLHSVSSIWFGNFLVIVPTFKHVSFYVKITLCLLDSYFCCFIFFNKSFHNQSNIMLLFQRHNIFENRNEVKRNRRYDRYIVIE